MDNRFKVTGVLLMFVFCICCLSKMAAAKSTALCLEDDWRLGIQTWTFRNFTFYEAIDKTAELGLSWIEACSFQPLSKEEPNMSMHYSMPAEIRNQVKEKLKESGVKLANYYVDSVPNGEAQCRTLFDFARDMGIETIVSEPAEEEIDLIEKLCKEYKIKLAIHNHPKPSRYWDPDKVLAVCKGRSEWIGVCADTGHWTRSSINPAEALKKLQGRIICLHLKDVGESGNRDAEDVVYGTGKANIEAILRELNRQDFKGVFSIEYEREGENLMTDVTGCIKYFDDVSSKLGHKRWRRLFNGKDLTGWIYKPGSWVVEPGGILFGKGLAGVRHTDIWTEEKFGDFILDLEFKAAPKSNSGVLLRTGDIEAFLHTAIEVQILDSYGKEEMTKEDCGAIFDCLSPSKNAVKKPGEWNRYIITCKANKIYVVLNGEQVIDMDLNLWTEAHKNPDGTPNKFNIAYKDMPRVGNIGLQYHNHPIWFRNVRIKPLD